MGSDGGILVVSIPAGVTNFFANFYRPTTPTPRPRQRYTHSYPQLDAGNEPTMSNNTGPGASSNDKSSMPVPDIGS